MKNKTEQDIPISKVLLVKELPSVSPESRQKAIERYEQLYLQQSFPKNKVLRHHLVDYILPGLAYYQTIKGEGLTQEEALSRVEAIFIFFADKRRKYLQVIGRLPFVYSLMRLRMNSAMKEYPPEGWQTEWIQNDHNAIKFNMRSCFFMDTLSKLGAAELTPVFCNVDDVVYEKMSPHIKWQRNQTIGKGAEYCDFCFKNIRKGYE